MKASNLLEVNGTFYETSPIADAVITASDINALRALLADGDRYLASNIGWVMAKLPVIIDALAQGEGFVKTLQKRCERAKDQLWDVAVVLDDAQEELRLCREKDGAGPYDPTLKARITDATCKARRGIE